MYNTTAYFARTLGAKDKQQRRRKVLTALGVGAAIPLAGTALAFGLRAKGTNKVPPIDLAHDAEVFKKVREAEKRMRNHARDLGMIPRPLSGSEAESLTRGLQKKARSELVTERRNKIHNAIRNSIGDNLETDYLLQSNKGLLTSTEKAQRKSLLKLGASEARRKYRANYAIAYYHLADFSTIS